MLMIYSCSNKNEPQNITIPIMELPSKESGERDRINFDMINSDKAQQNQDIPQGYQVIIVSFFLSLLCLNIYAKLY